MAFPEPKDASGRTNGEHRNGGQGVHPPHTHPPPPTPIVIVGMSMRLPGGVDNEAKLWDLLVNKKDAISPVPKDRYKGHGKSGLLDTNQGYFLNDLDLAQMDAGFFSMSKAEADQLDPHHRLLLEVVYEAFESAGETKWRGKDIGCYVGFSAEDWNDLQAKDPQDFPMYRVTGSFDFALANRISYEYDLRGPSFVIKAACASSSLSFHLACEAVAHGECSSAVACGANLVLTPAMTVALYEAGALSADISCKTFDAAANGYARADAINAVYIKRLDDAIRDGNPIRAIVRATATNFDGKTSGISNPSTLAQDALIRKTYRQAGLDVAETAFCECHGTGTAIGDPIEAMAVANVWHESGGVLVGSVKPNVGHAEAASGLTSVIKAVLCLENKTIVPNIKFNTPNSKIPWESARLVVPTEPTSWPEGRKERISVNNFGFGGANCHVIIDAAESFLPSYFQQQGRNSTIDTRLVTFNGTNGVNGHGVNGDGVDGLKSSNPLLLVFSANHEESLAFLVKNVEKFCIREQPSLNNLAYTLGARREHLPYRAFAIAEVSAPFDVTTMKAKTASTGAKPVFVFTGQGAQWPGMGKELMTAYTSFLQDICMMDAHLATLKQPPGFSMETEMRKPASTSLLDQAQYAQPICTAIQVALVNLLRSWGVQPSGVIGHSGGDVAAAYAAGVYTMEEAVTISYCRGQALKAQTRQGGMAAIGLAASEVASLLPPAVSVACVNSGSSVTISGDDSALDSFIEDFTKTRPGVFARRVRVEMAYHSHHMQDVAGLYQQLLEGCITPKNPTIPYYSTVKDKFLTEAKELGPSYWISNLLSPVLFHSGVKAILNHPQLMGNPQVEIGPHPALAGPLKQVYKEVDAKPQYQSLLSRNVDARRSVLKAMGQLFSAGVEIDFAAMYPNGVTLSNLPNYAWHREGNYWHESRVMKRWRFKQFAHHDILGSRVAEASDLEPVWRNLLRPDTVPAWVREHVVRTDTVFPAAAYIVMAGEAVSQLSGASDYTVRNVTIIDTSPLIIQPGESLEIITSLRPHRLTTTVESVWYDFSILSNSTVGWVEHCHGQVRSGPGSKYEVGDNSLLPRSVPAGRWYKAWRRLGLEYGPSFRGLQDVSVGTDQKLVSATVVGGFTESESSYQLHPTSMTIIIQAIDTAMHYGQTRTLTEVYQLNYVEELYVGLAAGNSTRVHLEAKRLPGNAVAGNGYGVSQNGELAVFLKGAKSSLLISDSDGRGSDPHGAVQLKWKPDIDMIDPRTLIRPKILMESAITMVEKLFVLCAIENQLQLVGHTAPEGHLQNFHGWLQEFLEFAKANKSRLVFGTAKLYELTSTERQAMIQDLMAKAEGTPNMAACRIIHKVYEAAVDIIDGKVDALELLFRDNMLTDFYNFFDWIDYQGLVELLGHENPNLRVLEIGAGTGSTTENVLKNLKTLSGQRLYSKYFYTDISAGFFIKAKERFKDHAGIEYRPFDVTRAPAEQGLEESSFDLVIAGNVLHATPSLVETLTNVRKLLRPRGRLLLSELCPESKFVDYIMGLLPGWWLGEADGRPKQPYVFPERWDEELRKAGFDGVESVCYDQKPPYQQNATMTARATDAVSQQQPRRLTVLAPECTSPNALALEEYLQGKGFEVDRCPLQQTPPPNQAVISAYELESTFLHDITEKEFRDLVDFVCGLGERPILWLTRQAQMAATDPRYSLVNGMARTIRSELNLPFGVLELDRLDNQAWEATLKVFEKLRGGRVEETDPDYEFALHNGVVHVSRFSDISVRHELGNIGVQGSPRRLQIAKNGILETLRWATWPQESALGPTEVGVDVHVSGMNNRDVYVAMGIVEGDDFGYECAGVVREVGQEVKGFQVGDRVMVLSEQSLSSRLRTSSQRCVRMPSSLSFEAAATMPSIYATVIRGLLGVGRLTRGQTVLVQAAAAPAGIAAMYICKAVGAQVYATTDSPEKAAFLTETFGIAKDRIFSSTDESFLTNILRATDGSGVGLVMNSLAGELLHASWQCVAENGIMIELGKQDIIGRGKLALDLFHDNRGFFGVDVARLCKGRPLEARKLLETIVAMYEAGEIKPFQPVTTYDARNISEAFQFMQKRSYDGKVAIRMPQDPNVLPGVAVLGQRDLFLPDVSYLLVGGLGGLGQAIATWMIERGARSLIFFSRSAANKDVHGAFFHELEASGCSVQAFSGDVGNLKDVKRAVTSASKLVAGVMQMSLILRDQSLAKMTIDEWNDVITPKVRGTWNLHEALGNNLDFFVMFSSVCGLAGQWGQANYAAANTFLDAFTQYRQHLGQPASVIDIGVMEDVGSLTTTNPGALEPLRASAYWMLIERDLLESLELMIWRSSKEFSPPQTHTAGSTVQAYTSLNQLGLGVRSTLPLSDPSNRVVWRRDRRMAVYRNDDDGTSAAAATASNNGLTQFLASVANNPAILGSEDSDKVLAGEIGRHLNSILRATEGDLDLQLGFQDLGADSLIMIELRSWLRQNLGTEISVPEILGCGSILDSGQLAGRRLKDKYDAATEGKGKTSA